MIPGTILALFEVHTFSEIAGASMSTPSAPRDTGEAPDAWVCARLLSVVHQYTGASGFAPLFTAHSHALSFPRVLPDWCVRVNLNLLPVPLWLVCLSACYLVLFASVCYPVIYSLVASMCVLTCRLTYSLSLGGMCEL